MPTLFGGVQAGIEVAANATAQTEHEVSQCSNCLESDLSIVPHSASNQGQQVLWVEYTQLAKGLDYHPLCELRCTLG